MTETMKVTVILTSYNHEKNLREAIDSVLNQTFSDFELIIWDDASTDSSWEIIQSYTDFRIRAFRNDKNRRANYGINKCLSEGIARGEYIAIHHSDDAWEYDKLEMQVAFLDTHPQIGAVFTWAHIVDDEGQPLHDKTHFYATIFDQPNRTRYEWLNYFFYHGNALCHPSVLLRKECYEKVGLYRYGMAQITDFDMWVRLCLKYEIHVLPERLIRFRVHKDKTNISSDRPDARIRWQFEYLQVLNAYKEIQTFQELEKIFPDAKVYEREDGEDVGYVLSMIALDAENHPSVQLFGLLLLFNALNDANRAKKIETLYDFTQQDLFSLTAQYDVFSVEKVLYLSNQLADLDGQISERNAQITELNTQIAERNAELHEIKSSKAWRFALLLREIRILLIPPDSLREHIARSVINRLRYLKVSFEQNKRDKQLLQNYSPKVSVIIPNYNHANFLEKRIITILNQSYQNFEILILDDCSIDNSREIIIKYAEKYPDKIKYIFNEHNSGNVFRQWRKGIEHTTGTLVWICESDDFSETDFLEKIIKHFANFSINIAFGRIQFSDEKGKLRKGLDHYREAAEKGIWNHELMRPAYKWFSNGFGVNNLIANVGGCVFRRQHISASVWEEAETYSVLGDWFLYCHIANGGMIAYSPDAVSYFRQHGENTSVSSFNSLAYYLEHQRLMETLKSFWDIPDKTVEKFVQKVEFQYKHFQLGKKFGDFDKHINRKILLEKKKEKLHILIGILGFSSGGGELFPIHLANQLQAAGCIASLFVYDMSTINEDMYAVLNKSVAVYTSSLVQKMGVENFIRDAGISLIHSHMIAVDAFFFNHNRVKLNIPYLVTLHGSYDFVASPEQALKNIVKGVNYWGYTADKNLDILQKNFQIPQDKFVKFPNAMPVDNEDFPMSRQELGITEDAVVFTFVARGIRSKGWEVAILAFIQLRNENPDLPMHLLLCGDGEETTRCENLYGNDSDITFLGYQPRINGLYRISDCAIVPTRFQGESYPLILIQAMQEGVPIIATDIGEIKNMLTGSDGEAGILVESTDDTTMFISGFEKAMCEMLNTDTRNYYQKAALRIGKKHDMKNVANQYLDFYKKMTRNS